ncbi:MAG: TetR/AcrR family transcriptional regulator [Rhodanobacter sp.]
MVQKDAKRPRGRPRAFDEDEALTQATGVFWRAGYSATSMDDLSVATGMNRPSLYGAFGDKQTLYLATLERYTRRSRMAMDAALDETLPLADALARVYEAALAIYFPPKEPPRGCFLIGTALAESVEDPEVRARLHDALAEFDQAFEIRLRAAQQKGELDANADVKALASVASAVLHTLALRSRAGDSRTALRATASEGVRLICGERPASAKSPHR